MTHDVDVLELLGDMIRWLYRRTLRILFGTAAPLVAFVIWRSSGGCRANTTAPASAPTGAATPTAATPPATAAPSKAAGTTRIGWWNLRHLGEEKKDTAAIGNVVASFDLFAAGEVMTVGAAPTLASALGAPWSSVQSGHSVGRGEHGREWYAMLFRAPASCDSSTGTIYPDRDDVFIREPFGVRCRVGQFDFWLVGIHVVFGKKKQGRIDEVAHLAEVVRFFQEAAPPERDVLLVGDFNLDAHHKGWSKLPSSLRRLVPADEKTTMGSDGHLAHHYDDVIIDPVATREATGVAGTVDLAPFEGGSEKAAFDAISDHRPVWAEFRTDLPDDD